jgi:hypothetical protein
MRGNKRFLRGNEGFMRGNKRFLREYVLWYYAIGNITIYVKKWRKVDSRDV